MASLAHQPEATAMQGKSRDGGNLTQVVSGPACWLYLVLGGGALVMIVVGLIVSGFSRLPDIPDEAAADVSFQRLASLAFPAT
jgi:hypothetical protein